MDRPRYLGRVFFLFLFLLQVVFLESCFAISDEDAAAFAFPTTNMITTEMAESVAANIISQYQAESARTGVAIKDMDPIIVFHVGNTLPTSLEWLLIKLEGADIPLLPTVQCTEDDLVVAADKAKDKALQGLAIKYRHQNPEEGKIQKRNLLQTWQATNIKLRQAFGLSDGLSGGLTAWFRVHRSANLKRLEAKLATITSLVKGGSVGFTFYLTNKAGTPAHELRAGIFLAICTWWFVYEARRFTEVMSLAKKVKPINEEGVYAVSESVLFRLVTNFIRSSVTNMIVMAAAFDLNHALSLDSALQNLLNTGIGLFAYYLVFDPIDKRMPELLDDGRAKINYSKGQWPLSKWLLVNSAATILYGLGKNIQLLNMGTWGNHLFLTLGMMGALKMIYSDKLNIKHEMLSFSDTIRRAAKPQYCEALLVFPSLKAF